MIISDILLDRQLYFLEHGEKSPHTHYEEFESSIVQNAEALRPF
jgi:hypothetical protein